jgi:hypothetical protein
VAKCGLMVTHTGINLVPPRGASAEVFGGAFCVAFCGAYTSDGLGARSAAVIVSP